MLEAQAFNNAYGNGSDPDSIQFGAANVFPPGWTGAAEFARVDFTPSDTGTIYVDTMAISPVSWINR